MEILDLKIYEGIRFRIEENFQQRIQFEYLE